MEHSATIVKTEFPFRERFNVNGQGTHNGEFEILAITAGQGNGWAHMPAQPLGGCKGAGYVARWEYKFQG